MFSKAYDTSFFPFLKEMTHAFEKIYKCKNLFKKFKNITNKLFCKSQVLKYESGIKSTWNIIKEVIAKRKVKSSFPKNVIVDIEIKDNLLIAEKYFSIIFLLMLTKIGFKNSSIE